MTPEEERRQFDLNYLTSVQNGLHEYQRTINFLQDEYRMGLVKAQDSEPKWEELTWGQRAKRAIGWEKTNVQKYEDGPGKNLKEQMAPKLQKIDTIWRNLEEYGIPPYDSTALEQAIEEKKWA